MKTLSVIYAPDMDFDVGTNTFPIGIKGRLFTTAALASGLPIRIVPPHPMDRAGIKLAHDSEYVDAVLDLRRDNGLFNRDPAVARALPYHCGGFLDASLIALEEGMALMPFSAFHHAEYADGHGLCTFNATMVAAMHLRQQRKAYRIAIIDTDLHYGDGTDHIIAALQLCDIFHFTTGKYFTGPSDAPFYLTRIRQLRDEIRQFRPDFMFYQAGGDAHLEDPFVGPLSTIEMYERDKIVFGICKELNIPVAFTLSGGYQRDEDGGFTRQTRLYLNTIRAALTMPCENDMTDDEVRFARLRVRDEPVPGS
ncbi:MAG: hypothetical protein FIA89_00920 [Geobacter sp.]|nr:hypothetical protein [Geobacter sp.]